MARYSERNRSLIDETVERWKDRCLLGTGSLIFDERDAVWSQDNVEELYVRFNERQLEGKQAGGTFESKWREQLKDASDDLRVLGAEMVLVHFLFASSVTREGKLTVIAYALEGTQIVLPQESPAVGALSQSVGHPGIGFNTRRDLQLAYLIDFVRRWKRLELAAQESLLDKPWELRDFADETDWPVREMRHILLHLLRPDEFERISSGSHKREIAAAFGGLLDGDDISDVDERLFAIREKLIAYVPKGNTKGGGIDFYHPPLHSVWESASGGGEGTGDLESLQWKKQIVLYGPPGTSKTWQARRLAETVIRRSALELWGPKEFFSFPESEMRDLVGKRLFWEQLHPGVGYEQFIRGLRLEGDETRYQLGTLPLIIERMKAHASPNGLPELPGVLVLDEINRTNLSEMLGEAFSLLERDQRGNRVELTGVDSGQDPEYLEIPSNLYIIGTMNEIDQSVETLDFALRRRFLWSECPFERDTILTIVQERWSEDVRVFSYEDAATQIERFADRASELNGAIGASAELGPQYAIGHTYFADIAFFIGPWARARKARPANGTYIWTAAGKPQPPLLDLWRRSLKPLLEQYLAGSDVRTDELARFYEALIRA